MTDDDGIDDDGIDDDEGFELKPVKFLRCLDIAKRAAAEAFKAAVEVLDEDGNIDECCAIEIEVEVHASDNPGHQHAHTHAADPRMN